MESIAWLKKPHLKDGRTGSEPVPKDRFFQKLTYTKQKTVPTLLLERPVY